VNVTVSLPHDDDETVDNIVILTDSQQSSDIDVSYTDLVAQQVTNALWVQYIQTTQKFIKHKIT